MVMLAAAVANARRVTMKESCCPSVADAAANALAAWHNRHQTHRVPVAFCIGFALRLNQSGCQGPAAAETA